jgi:dipeptidyl aminopeptidase/acylaminoacyl peptidase
MARPGLIAALVWSLAGAAVARPADGALVESRPCPPRTLNYDDYVARQVADYRDEAALGAGQGVRMPPPELLPHALPSREEYEGALRAPSACSQVFYGSDGLKVAAFVWKPAAPPPGKLPVIVMLRGGNRDFGKFTPASQQGMHAFVTAGFLVIGVQYRGVDGGEGVEQFGGADVRDVLNAIKLARNLPEADPTNVFLHGGSRGGMMVYLALRDGAEINAAVALNALADPLLELKRRPELGENVWSKLIPGYAERSQEVLRERSGLEVAKRVDMPPILLLHGTADWRAHPDNSLEVAKILQARDRPYELHLFYGDGHGLPFNWRERDRLTIGWFRRNMGR